MTNEHISPEARTRAKLVAQQGNVSRDFGILDKKARRVGGTVRLTVIEHVDIRGEAGCYSVVRPGTYFVARPHATRDGNAYGALQPDQYFVTERERAAYVERYFEQAAKRARKQFTTEAR